MTRLAMVTAANRSTPYLAAYDDNIEAWRDIPHGAFCVNSPTSCRPVVVIDPEDRKQVKRLRSALIAHDMLDISWDEGPSVRRVTDALRSLIAPPKPPEPTGLGAVVEDASGDRWIRDGLPSDRAEKGDWWNHSCAARDYANGDLRANYADIAAAKVLSEGVSA